jgi:ABC-2 type transport system permease protein
MINQLRADWYRQWHTVGFYIVIIFSAFYGAFATWQHVLSGLIVNAPEKLMDQLIAKKWSVLDTLHAVTISSSFLLYVFIALVVILVGYEFSQHTYKNSLITGISRLQFVLSKYLMLLVDLCLCVALFYGSAVTYALLEGARLGASVGTLWRQGLLLGGTITFFMSVVFALAILILLATGSLVISTIFAVVWPLLISMIHSFVNWHWLIYLDFLNSSMKITLGQISSNEQWRYLGVSVGLLIFAILGATLVIRRREL